MGAVAVKAEATLDCVGLFCPVPIYLTAQRLARLPTAAVLEVVCDDPAIAQDLPAWCRKTSHAIVAQAQQGRLYRYWVRKATAPGAG